MQIVADVGRICIVRAPFQADALIKKYDIDAHGIAEGEILQGISGNLKGDVATELADEPTCDVKASQKRSRHKERLRVFANEAKALLWDALASGEAVAHIAEVLEMDMFQQLGIKWAAHEMQGSPLAERKGGRDVIAGGDLGSPNASAVDHDPCLPLEHPLVLEPGSLTRSGDSVVGKPSSDHAEELASDHVEVLSTATQTSDNHCHKDNDVWSTLAPVQNHPLLWSATTTVGDILVQLQHTEARAARQHKVIADLTIDNCKLQWDLDGVCTLLAKNKIKYTSAFKVTSA